MSNQAADTAQVSLDSVFKALTHWRNNRRAYDTPGIPDEIWVAIFQLEGQGYPDKELRRMFGLNTTQYKRNRSIYYPSQSNPDISKPIKSGVNLKQLMPQFNEAIIEQETLQAQVPALAQAAQQAKQAITQLKSPGKQTQRYLDTTTVIVECIRPDGHRLKIHTTNSRLDVLMQCFFTKETSL